TLTGTELKGTPYGREIKRRLRILLGQSSTVFTAATETPQFRKSSGGPPPLPPPPKSSRSFAAQTPISLGSDSPPAATSFARHERFVICGFPRQVGELQACIKSCVLDRDVSELCSAMNIDDSSGEL